jgi:hypothetical protein
MVVAVLLLGAPGAPTAIPLLAPAVPISQHFADQLGWEERVASVGAAWAQPISGHNNYYLWGLPPGAHDVVLALGGRAEDHSLSFADVAMVGRTPIIPYGIPGESSIPIYVLRRPTRPLAEAFREAKTFE